MFQHEVNLIDYWKIIKKYRRMIMIIVGVVSVFSVIASLLMTKIYRAEAVIIPVSSEGGGMLSSLASQFGGLASMAGISLPGDGGDTEKLVAILLSRTLVENVIKREKLMPILFDDTRDGNAKREKSSDSGNQQSMEEAVRRMRLKIAIMDDKKMKTIKIITEFRDPKVAARVANAYVAELQNFINANAFTTAKRNRLFIEGRLAQNKRELLEAGKEINVFYQEGRVSPAEAKIDVPILQGQESGLSRMAGSPASDAALSSLMAQREDVERKIAKAQKVEDVPQQVYLTYMMMRRELLAKVNALLTTQYEMAKIEEAKEDLSFQVIDYAVPPLKRYKPRRSRICIMSFFAALFCAVIIAFFREYIHRMRESVQR